MFRNYIINSFIFLFLFVTFFVCIPIIPNSLNENLLNTNSIDISSSGFAWPIPGYTKVTSNFGSRKSPTAGASSYHYGTDIGAPEGTNLIAVTDGQITFLGFLGAGGYTLTLSFANYKVSYCHISPQFLVKENEHVVRGQVIANVGPKYVYNVLGNKYSDSSGIPTNGATTGTHLHIGFRINNKYVNPLDFFN